MLADQRVERGDVGAARLVECVDVLLAGSVLAKDEALKSMWREGSARP